MEVQVRDRSALDDGSRSRPREAVLHARHRSGPGVPPRRGPPLGGGTRLKAAEQEAGVAPAEGDGEGDESAEQGEQEDRDDDREEKKGRLR
ncbi:hypothetical protein GCM10027294_09430 [Marinactinospora endophytica]